MSPTRWCVVAYHRLPDGRRRLQVMPGDYATESEAQGVAYQLAAVPEVEFRAAPMSALEGEYLAIEIEEEEWRARRDGK